MLFGLSEILSSPVDEFSKILDLYSKLPFQLKERIENFCRLNPHDDAASLLSLGLAEELKGKAQSAKSMYQQCIRVVGERQHNYHAVNFAKKRLKSLSLPLCCLDDINDTNYLKDLANQGKDYLKSQNSSAEVPNSLLGSYLKGMGSTQPQVLFNFAHSNPHVVVNIVNQGAPLVTPARKQRPLSNTIKAPSKASLQNLLNTDNQTADQKVVSEWCKRVRDLPKSDAPTTQPSKREWRWFNEEVSEFTLNRSPITQKKKTSEKPRVFSQELPIAQSSAAHVLQKSPANLSEEVIMLSEKTPRQFMIGRRSLLN